VFLVLPQLYYYDKATSWRESSSETSSLVPGFFLWARIILPLAISLPSKFTILFYFLISFLFSHPHIAWFIEQHHISILLLQFFSISQVKLSVYNFLLSSSIFIFNVHPSILSKLVFLFWLFFYFFLFWRLTSWLVFWPFLSFMTHTDYMQEIHMALYIYLTHTLQVAVTASVRQ